jgi:hypothetical protein
MGLSALDVELVGQLSIHCLDDLAHRVDQMFDDLGCWPRSSEQRRDLLPDIVSNDVHPGAEIIEIVYHGHVLQLACDWSGDLVYTSLGDISSNRSN